MVDRKLLIEDWQQIEQALTELDRHEQDRTTMTQAERDKWLIALARVNWHVLEYLVRRAEK
jgi:hypothetical protein